MRAAGVLDGLSGEEKVIVIYSFRIVGAVLQSIFGRADVFEKEYDAVDRRPPTLPQCSNSVWVEGDELLELHIFDSELLHKGSEDALIRLDSAPASSGGVVGHERKYREVMTAGEDVVEVSAC